MFYRRACFAVQDVLLGYVLQEGIFYRMICYTGDTLYEDKFNWMVCSIGSHALHEGMSYRWTCLAGIHVI